MPAIKGNPRDLFKATARHAGRGFSLIELIVVISIIAVMGALVAPRLSASTAESHFRQVTDRILNALREARQIARETSAPVEIQFDAANDWILVKPKSRASYTIPLSVSPYQVTIEKVTVGAGGDTAQFNGYGELNEAIVVGLSYGGSGRTLVLRQQDAKDDPVNAGSGLILDLGGLLGKLLG